MQLALLADPQSWHAQDLQRAARAKQVLRTVSFAELEGLCLPGRSEAADPMGPLSTCQGLLIRTMPGGSLEQVIFRMDALRACHAGGMICLNSPQAMEVAIDKYLTSCRLVQAGLSTPVAWCGQTQAGALAAYEQLGPDVVVKPLFGSQGRGLIRVRDGDSAARCFQMLQTLGSVIYFQRYIEHGGTDFRVLVLGEQTWCMQRTHPTDWRTNASRGAQCTAAQLPAAVLNLARQAAQAIGAELAGVDLAQDPSGSWQVLEVNASPSWRWISTVTGQDIAAAVWDYFALQISLGS